MKEEIADAARLLSDAHPDVIVFHCTDTSMTQGPQGEGKILDIVLTKRGTPDAIDLLVVCSESGMGLESGLARVAQEMQETNPAIARVMTGLLDDLRILPSRSDAFEKLGATSDGLRRFGIMVGQSLQYGTPVGQALRSIAVDLRRERITKLEERAHKLGAKLTIPMVLFLLPAMFVILGGSPILHLVRSFASFGK